MSVMGDGVTIKKKPFFNVLVNKHGTPPVVKEVHDCSKHLASGRKKDAEHTAKTFLPTMTKLDPGKSKFDLFIVDGASNVQGAGEVVKAVFPRVSTIHGAEHLLSLFFSDISKIQEIEVSVCFFCVSLSCFFFFYNSCFFPFFPSPFHPIVMHRP